MKNSTIDELALNVKDQADQLFPHRTDHSMFQKLWEELGEFAKDPGEQEFADVQIMLLDYAARKHWVIERLIRAKMAINQNRQWVEVNGVMRHV